jgi:sodium transport system ATP-binding protein
VDFPQGERVKTAIARALVHGSHNVVADEPTNGLDVTATRACARFLRSLGFRVLHPAVHAPDGKSRRCAIGSSSLAGGRVGSTVRPMPCPLRAGGKNLEEGLREITGAGGDGRRAAEPDTHGLHKGMPGEPSRDRRVLINKVGCWAR